MTKVQGVLACGACEVPLKGPAQPKAEDIVACPDCGRSDTFKRAKSEADKFFKDQLGRGLSGGLAKLARRTPGLTHKPAHRVKRDFRFIYING
ncbi:MAG: hypothetical protein PVI23_07025 [Maricaulaceae bacterium]|jgi:hypothetical protein